MDVSNAWINGRTLAKFLESYKPNHSFGKFGPQERIKIVLPRDLYALGAECTYPPPFVIEENLFITVRDLDTAPTVIDFANIRFSVGALKSAANELANDALTQEVEELGRQLTGGAQFQVLHFSERVCAWGRGQRVWGNLKRHYSQGDLAAVLDKWLSTARSERGAVEAIVPGIAIRGLGVSFASKHLRHLAPERFGVLDDVISQGLGYALNPAGYVRFISDVTRLRDEFFPGLRIADVEGGLFFLIRQMVRGKE